MIIRLTHNAERILRHSQQVPAAMIKGLAAALDEENEYTLALVQKKRLSFPKEGPSTLEGLRHISGRLKKSMRRDESENVFSAAQADGGRIFSTIGSNVRYAGVLEEGFTGTVQVGPYVRRHFRTQTFLRAAKSDPVYKATTTKRRKNESAEAFFARSVAREQAARARFNERMSVFQYENRDKRTLTRKVRGADVAVGAHDRNVNITGRHYLRRSVEEREGDYRDALSAAVVKAWNGGKP